VFGLFQLPFSSQLTITPGSPGMPKLLVGPNFLSRLREFYVSMEAESIMRFEASISKDLKRIPIGFDDPSNTRLEYAPNFFPYDMQNWNVGSNFGLVSWLEELLVTEVKKPAQSYKLLLCDINIFVRSLRVNLFLTLLYFVSFCMIHLITARL
jgi:hypothetical protein